MNISEQQSRNIYAVFTVLFAVNVIYTIWNIHEQAKLRELEKKIAHEKLKYLQNGNLPKEV